MSRLDGMTTMITGAGSGFGEGIARAFAGEGATVIVTDLDGERADAVAGELARSGARAKSLAVDVTDPASLGAAADDCLQTFGGLDTLVANAGIGQRPRPFESTPAGTVRDQFAVNALGAYMSCQAALPALRQRPGSSILITVSGIALVPRPQLYGYGMAKAAAMYLMKSLALELAPERIRVNGLFPAVGDTPMLTEFAGGERTETTDQTFAGALPLGRLITPEDVGHAAVFLASPREAGAMTGCALPVDGGRCI